MNLSIPRFCNDCGKRFLYKIESGELHQQRGGVIYLCDDCLYRPENEHLDQIFSESRVPAFRYRGSHERLDQIWEERHDRL